MDAQKGEEVSKHDNEKEQAINTQQQDDDVIENFSIEYKRDIEGCMEYVQGGLLDDPERRFDEVSYRLVDEEKEERQKNFDKLNLPESEQLLTETSEAHFPENNSAVEPTIKVDSATINQTLKTTGKEVVSTAKSWYNSAKDFRERRKKENEERKKQLKALEEMKEDYKSSAAEVTHIDELISKETNLKTIEEMKDPNLVSYPINRPKTVEEIQDNNVENAKDMDEAKRIIEPKVNVAKDLPQKEEDPYIDPKADQQPKKQTWYEKAGHEAWNKTKEACKWVRDSDVAKQVIGVGICCAVVGLGIVKRHSFVSINSVEQLQRVLKSPSSFHGSVQAVNSGSNSLAIKQIPFPRYLSKSTLTAVADPTTYLPLSLLALNPNETENKIINELMQNTENVVKKVKVFYYPSQVNSTLSDTMIYGDLLIKGFGTSFITRSHYHSLSRYLVRMGYCSVDRDINIDINKITQKHMKHLSGDELYAIRRKLGMWEERSSSFEDNLLVRGWFAFYRPIYKRFILPRNKEGNSSIQKPLSVNSTVILSNVQLNAVSTPGVQLHDRTVKCYALSRKGYYRLKTKINQDRCLCYYDEKTQSLIAGVFDGHGENGHIISESIRDLFVHSLVNNPLFQQDPLGSMYSAIREAEEKTLARICWYDDSFQGHQELCDFNGTTAIAAVICSNKFYAMNIGDSRMFYAVRSEEGKVVTENVTSIHCPDMDIERKRIEQCGGRVTSLRSISSSISTPRVHPAGDSDDSGLAMSRSICDTYFHRCGVISEPDLYEKIIKDHSIGLLIGSDGLTTVFGMSNCIKQVLEKEDPAVGLSCLVDNCYNMMYQYSEAKYVDDISGVYIDFSPTE